MSHKQWIYHETKEPMIIDSDTFANYEDDGWKDSPACFINYEDIGISKQKIDDGDEEEAAKAQQILDAVGGVKDSLNKTLNISKMSKDELEEFALEHFGVDIDRRKTLKSLRKEVRSLTG